MPESILMIQKQARAKDEAKNDPNRKISNFMQQRDDREIATHLFKRASAV